MYSYYELVPGFLHSTSLLYMSLIGIYVHARQVIGPDFKETLRWR